MSSEEEKERKIDRSTLVPEKYKEIYKKDRDKYIKEKTIKNLESIKTKSKNYSSFKEIRELILSGV